MHEKLASVCFSWPPCPWLLVACTPPSLPWERLLVWSWCRYSITTTDRPSMIQINEQWFLVEQRNELSPENIKEEFKYRWGTFWQVIACSCTESWDNTDPGVNLGLFSYFLCSITKTKGNKKLLQLDCEDSEEKWSLFTFKSHNILLNFFWLLPSMRAPTLK